MKKKSADRMSDREYVAAIAWTDEMEADNQELRKKRIKAQDEEPKTGQVQP